METLGEVDLDELHDEYRAALEELITAKAEGKELPAAPEPAAGGKVLDLTAALERSVRAAKEARGGETGGAAEVRRLPARKTARTTPKEVGGKKSTAAAKKTAAKKTTAKSTSTAKKATADRTAAEKTTAKSTSTAKKATAGKATAGKTTADKTTADKTTADKTTAKKTGSKKTAAKRAPARTRTA
jgi:DNA end-binding protein Ku